MEEEKEEEEEEEKEEEEEETGNGRLNSLTGFSPSYSAIAGV